MQSDFRGQFVALLQIAYVGQVSSVMSLMRWGDLVKTLTKLEVKT